MGGGGKVERYGSGRGEDLVAVFAKDGRSEKKLTERKRAN